MLGTIAIRRQYSTEDVHDRDVVVGLRNRYTTAADQLGNSSPAIRLAGVYAMAALADDWDQRGEMGEVQTCIDVLCAIMRTPAHHLDHRRVTPQEKAGDREVRQTVIRVIRDHLQPDAEPHWRGKNFDFSGAEFNGDYSFSGATFSGGLVSFYGATFSGGTRDLRRRDVRRRDS